MSKFKVGDRVRLVKLNPLDNIVVPGLRVGLCGTIMEDDNCPYVRWDGVVPNEGFGGEGEYAGGWAVTSRTLELASEPEPEPEPDDAVPPTEEEALGVLHQLTGQAMVLRSLMDEVAAHISVELLISNGMQMEATLKYSKEHACSVMDAREYVSRVLAERKQAKVN